MTTILVARMGSTRFPGKSMAEILGKPLIERIVERISKARSVGRIVLATTTAPADDPLASLAQRLGILCHRGPAEDVLGRIHQAWRRFGGESLMELLGDNPLVHASLIDAVVELYRSGSFDYAANATKEYPNVPAGMPLFPVGVRVQVYSASALERLAAVASDPQDREHPARYLIHRPAQFAIGYLPAAGAWACLHHPEWTFAVNYPRNLALVRKLFELCSAEDPHFDLQAVMRVAESGLLDLDQMAQVGEMERVA